MNEIQNSSNQQAVDMGALLKQLLNNDYIPKNLKEDWWFLTSDDIILSFHDKQDITWLMNQFDLLELRTIRSLEGHKYNLDVVRQINQCKIVFFAKLNRSKDGGERKAQISQITNDIVTQEKPHAEGTGFFSSVKSLFKGGT